MAWMDSGRYNRTAFSILINGSPKGFFAEAREGDLLSLFCIFLVSEAFSKMIKVAKGSNLI